MKKDLIVKAMAHYIQEMSEKYGLTVTDNGTGKAFDNSVWKDILTDDSNIPNIVAANPDMKIEMRSFWGCPEISIREYQKIREDLMVLTYSDGEYRDFTEADDISSTTVRNLMKKGLLTVEAFDTATCDLNEELGYRKICYKGKQLDIKIPEPDKDDEFKGLTYEDTCHIAWKLDDMPDIKKDIASEGLTVYENTGNFRVHEVRVDSYDYEYALQRILGVKDYIAKEIKTLEKETNKNGITKEC